MNRKRYKPLVYIYKLGVYMESVTSNELKVLLRLVKDNNSEYNSNNLSKVVGLSSMGVLKILKKLERMHVLKTKKLGRINYYKPDYANDYAMDFLSFALRKEGEESKPKIKRWITELKQLSNNSIILILFGSVITKEEFNDIDLLAVIDKSQNNYFDKKINSLNEISAKKIHVIKQSLNDFKNNLLKNDKVLINALRNGVVIHGHEQLLKVLKECQ